MSWPISEEFEERIYASARTQVMRLTLFNGGQEVASTDTISLYDLQHLDGRVSVFRRSQVRRTMSLSLLDNTGIMVPLVTGDYLDPVAGSEVLVEMGMRLSGGVSEYVPQGRFGIRVTNVTDTHGAVSLDLTASDRAATITDNPWRTPYVIAAGTNTGTAIKNAILDRLTGVGTITFNFDPTDETVEDELVLGGDDNNDPWKELQNLALGAGMELYFDQVGNPTMKPVPDPDSTEGAIHFHEGAGGIILDPVTRTIDKGTLRNGAIVFSEAPWLLFPIMAEVWDDNPTSPTRRALVGEFPEKTGDATVFNQSQADSAALALFNQVHGIEEQVQWDSVPHYALDVGDVVHTHVDTSLPVTGAYTRLDTLEIPLSVQNPMRATARRRRQ